ncbi:NmrA family NAD(P)-binding protein [Sphingosinicella sp. CPCC 101087]|uniref:NmrA family NAD(P)-binding protein n=1 Tax=Sphingosinicella sp. CPCC 101087 TaxID=2497754 RepID=UPI00101BAFC7|nr:NmrA family NAD(P)-binding protein [Sphingosinicella sp. CPCC 101087]
MFIILGGTGHVGSAAAKALLDQGEAVTIVTRNPSKAEPMRARGAAIAVADVRDVEAMRQVFRRGRRLFMLNPPADPATDTDAVERETIRCLLQALDQSGLEKIVAQSTYGARPGERCGDLTTLHELEVGLGRQEIPVSIIRAAYYMSNWDGLFDVAVADGVLPTMLPEDLRIPMVAPQDIGKFAARLLAEPAERTGLHHVEGPERYTPRDVAIAFGKTLGKPVRPVAIPRDQWIETFRELGFSEPAAASYARMTVVTVDEAYEPPEAPVRGEVTLERYVEALSRRPAPRM